jgi:uncharacterized membrane protein
MSESDAGRFMHKNRVEALNDGIYAVAMTLLVLELRVPDTLAHASDSGFVNALVQLLPKFIAWVLSFFILAVFWMGHQRAFHYVRHVDIGLVWINIVALLFASLMPFSSALIGEHGARFASQAFYAANMAALALATLWQLSHLVRHPGLCDPPLPRALVTGARVRGWSLVALAAIAVGIAAWEPRRGVLAFLLMFLLAPLARRAEARAAAKDAPLTDRTSP